MPVSDRGSDRGFVRLHFVTFGSVYKALLLDTINIVIKKPILTT